MRLHPTTYLSTSERNLEFTPRLPSEAERQRAKRSYNLHPRFGFTLIEILVVLGVFAVVIGILGQIFAGVTKTQRAILAQQRLIEEGRNILDMIVDETHRGQVNYAAYGAGLSSTLNILRLIGRDGAFVIKKSDSAVACGFTGDIRCLLIERANGTTHVLTSASVHIERFDVMIDPMQDPFVINPGTGVYTTNVQPRVTIVLTLDSGEISTRGKTPITIQTSVTPRAYLR